MNHRRVPPRWLRRALYATAVMNVSGSLAFVPAGQPIRALAGFPEPGHPFYLWLLAIWIAAFGVAYGWSAHTNCVEPVFLAVATVGKLSFAGLLIGYAATGGLPAPAALGASGDLVFGLLFLYWLSRRP